jgi:hypothetical protein
MKIGSTTPDQTGFPQTVSLTVTAKQIADLMTSFVEGGDPVTFASKGGWCWSVDAAPDHRKAHGTFWYAEPAFYEQPGFILKIKTNEDDSGIENAKEHLIGACAFHAGLTKIAADPDYRYALLALVDDEADAAAADIIMQFVVFGKEVFA